MQVQMLQLQLTRNAGALTPTPLPAPPRSEIATNTSFIWPPQGHDGRAMDAKGSTQAAAVHSEHALSAAGGHEAPSGPQRTDSAMQSDSAQQVTGRLTHASRAAVSTATSAASKSDASTGLDQLAVDMPPLHISTQATELSLQMDRQQAQQATHVGGQQWQHVQVDSHSSPHVGDQQWQHVHADSDGSLQWQPGTPPAISARDSTTHAHGPMQRQGSRLRTAAQLSDSGCWDDTAAAACDDSNGLGMQQQQQTDVEQLRTISTESGEAQLHPSTQSAEDSLGCVLPAHLRRQRAALSALHAVGSLQLGAMEAGSLGNQHMQQTWQPQQQQQRMPAAWHDNAQPTTSWDTEALQQQTQQPSTCAGRPSDPQMSWQSQQRHAEHGQQPNACTATPAGACTSGQAQQPHAAHGQRPNGCTAAAAGPQSAGVSRTSSRSSLSKSLSSGVTEAELQQTLAVHSSPNSEQRHASTQRHTTHSTPSSARCHASTQRQLAVRDSWQLSALLPVQPSSRNTSPLTIVRTR